MRAQLRKLILLLLLLDISLATLYVSQWPRRLEVPSGSNVTLHCEVLGLTEPRVIIYPYWVIGGTEEGEEERVVYPPPQETQREDALPESEIGTGLSLQVRHLRPSHSNTYRCLASVHLPDRRLLLRGNGTVLLVRDSSLSTIYVSQWPRRLEVPSGSNVTLHCEVLGLTEPRVIIYPYWVISGMGEGEEERVIYPAPEESRQEATLPESEIGTGLSLQLRHLRPSHSNTYRCLASVHLPDRQLLLRGNGTVLLVRDISLATLYVTQWPQRVEVPSGSNVTLHCEVLGLTDPRVKIYPFWVVGEKGEGEEERVVYPLPEGSQQQDALPESEIDTGLSLQLRHLRPSHSNTYRCLASVRLPDRPLLLRGNGTVLLVRDGSLVTLYVSQWPRRLEVPSGSNVTLHCEVLGLTEPRVIIDPYWVVGGTEDEGEERVLYPPPEGSRQQDALPECEIGTGLSLQLRHLRPSHSNTYRCLASVHLTDRRLLLRGNGTVLLVRDISLATLSVFQWPRRLEVPSGSNVTLHCEVLGLTEPRVINYPYWVVGGTEEEGEERVVYPPPPPPRDPSSKMFSLRVRSARDSPSNSGTSDRATPTPTAAWRPFTFPTASCCSEGTGPCSWYEVLLGSHCLFTSCSS
ncbi:uncharacterized protein LOC134350234 [Mobula hypostoma]|uniref:uncharacterized protein LOC134350234 n=1 Tax=Mobula hypostoma TaxID=723540 RepID=UPI002FC3A4AB